MRAARLSADSTKSPATARYATKRPSPHHSTAGQHGTGADSSVHALLQLLLLLVLVLQLLVLLPSPGASCSAQMPSSAAVATPSATPPAAPVKVLAGLIACKRRASAKAAPPPHAATGSPLRLPRLKKLLLLLLLLLLVLIFPLLWLRGALPGLGGAVASARAAEPAKSAPLSACERTHEKKGKATRQ